MAKLRRSSKTPYAFCSEFSLNRALNASRLEGKHLLVMLTVKAVRPYSLSQIEKYKSLFPHPYEAQALKLRKLLTQHHQQKTCSRTFGILDPVALVQSAPYLDSVYVSGWQCASVANSNNLYGPDYADYSSNTVPQQVERLFRAQQFHSKRLDKDLMHPIIADADTGFGGKTNVMKTTEMLLISGCAGIHLEDQVSTGKRCGHLGGKTLVPAHTHIDRLLAARLQADRMGSSMVLVSRTDAESATHIESDIDSRDRPFIIGKFFSHKLQGDFTLQEVIQKLCCLKKISLPPLQYLAFTEMLELMRQLAPGATFDIAGCRDKNSGYYPIRNGTEYAIHRARIFEPHSDLTWIETSKPDYQQALQISNAVPGLLAYNLSPSFDWGKYLNEKQLKDFSSEIAKHRFVFQFCTLANFHLYGLAVTRFAKAFQQNGMLAYTKLVQDRERIEKVETLKHQEWSGVNLSDEILSLISKDQRTLEGSTEKHFR
jgi:isocitrate lyase